ncbi:hypothetical protein [Streptomyces sp. ODS28]|uniref:hypothetical protein n=1 Tax=Streptomyces sp. ODS28 TaxID=3136688 RepID=UPI0031E8C0EF
MREDDSHERPDETPYEVPDEAPYVLAMRCPRCRTVYEIPGRVRIPVRDVVRGLLTLPLGRRAPTAAEGEDRLREWRRKDPRMRTLACPACGYRPAVSELSEGDAELEPDVLMRCPRGRCGGLWYAPRVLVSVTCPHCRRTVPGPAAPNP